MFFGAAFFAGFSARRGRRQGAKKKPPERGRGCWQRSAAWAVEMFQSTVAPIRRLTPRPTDRGRADCPSLKGGGTEKDFIGFAVLSTTRFPLKGELSNHKGIFDELPL